MSSVPVLSGVDVVSAACPGDRRCVVVGNLASGSVSSGPPVRDGGVVLVSVDGGSTWSPGRIAGSAVRLLGGLSCPAVTRCYATASGVGSSSRGFLLVSSDGGRLWRPDRFPVIPAALQAITCPTPNACYSVGTTADIGSIQVPGDVILETSDGGRRWTSQPIPVFPQPPSGTSGDAIPGSGLTSISCTNPDTCVAGGPAGVLATTDGTRWRIRYETPTPGYGNQEASSPPGQLQLLACPPPRPASASSPTPTVATSSAEAPTAAEPGPRSHPPRSFWPLPRSSAQRSPNASSAARTPTAPPCSKPSTPPDSGNQHLSPPSAPTTPLELHRNTVPSPAPQPPTASRSEPVRSAKWRSATPRAPPSPSRSKQRSPPPAVALVAPES